MTVVVEVALLLSGFGSVSFPATVAVLVSVPGVVVVTTILIVALVPFERLPRLQVMVPPLGEVSSLPIGRKCPGSRRPN